MSILQNQQKVMDKICHDCIKLKYGSKANLCYMDT